MRYLCSIGLLLLGCANANQDKVTAPTIDVVANQYINQSQYVGFAIAAQHQHQFVFQQAWGYSDYVNKKPFTTDEMLALGSNAKTLTAAGILLLESSNKLKLKDKLSKHLPLIKICKRCHAQRLVVPHFGHTRCLWRRDLSKLPLAGCQIT